MATAATMITANSFVDDAPVDADMRPPRRKLMQADDDDTTPPGPMRGPETFYHGPDFLMKVEDGIGVDVFSSDSKSWGKPLDRIELDKAASAIKGSWINGNKTEYMVTIDWKSTPFSSKTGRMNLKGIIIKMTFEKKSGGSVYALTKMEADQMVLNGENIRDAAVRVRLFRVQI